MKIYTEYKNLLYLILISALLFALGWGAVLGSIVRSQSGMLPHSSENIKLDKYMMHFYQSDLTTEILKINPYNDYYYTDSEKNHFYNQATFADGDDITKDFLSILKRLLFVQQRIVWKAKGKNGSEVIYEIRKDNKYLKIARDVSKLKKGIKAIGQGIEYCQGCLITDQLGRAFFNQENFNQENIDFAKTLLLVPVSITGKLLPDDVTKLTIIDSNGNPKADIFIEPGSQIFLEDKYSVLEVKTKTINHKTTQEVYLYN